MSLIHKACSKIFSRLFIRFIIGGAGGYLFTMGATYALTEILKTNYFIFYAVSFTLITILNYIIAVKYIFKVSDEHHKRFIRYTFFVIIFYFANLFVVKLLTDRFGIYYLAAITIGTGMLFIAKFLIYDSMVFHKK